MLEGLLFILLIIFIQTIFNIKVFKHQYNRTFIFIMLFLTFFGTIIFLFTFPSFIFWLIKLSSSYKIDNSSR